MKLEQHRKPTGVQLPKDLKRRVDALVKASTITAAARQLDINEGTLYRILGGGSVSKGTVAVVAARLQATTEEG